MSILPCFLTKPWNWDISVSSFHPFPRKAMPLAEQAAPQVTRCCSMQKTRAEPQQESFNAGDWRPQWL